MGGMVDLLLVSHPMRAVLTIIFGLLLGLFFLLLDGLLLLLNYSSILRLENNLRALVGLRLSVLAFAKLYQV